jgi:hypothetical protein
MEETFPPVREARRVHSLESHNEGGRMREKSAKIKALRFDFEKEGGRRLTQQVKNC